ncbi:I78 family peptidase inhibitor [Erythrobacter sp.]|uniref:I78 family peptidase inhibitor n=1 Tax=Erythrobacter sp. TaxID=1042 RepID=UPI0025D9EAD5|nr:I78 family peptidase inhibitor [Erythrobacter sp.]
MKLANSGLAGIGLAAFGLAGCAAGSGGEMLDTAIAPMTCDAAPAQYHIGHDATQAMGAAILKDSGARTLRWGPPNSAWTMDYRQDRVNVRYDGQMKIVEITCG